MSNGIRYSDWDRERQRDPMTAQEFLDYYKININHLYRIGQVAFNRLEELRPDLAGRIRGTEIDPYYDNHRLPKFEEWIIANWGIL